MIQLILSLVLASHLTYAYDSLPETARPRSDFIPDPTKGYALTDYGHGVYIISDGIYWMMAVASHTEAGSGQHSGNNNGNGNANGYGNGNGRGNGPTHTQPTPKTLLIIDAPTGFFSNQSMMAVVNECLQKSGATTVSDLLYSHQHTDHIGMMGLIRSHYPRAKIHASTKVCERLRKRADPRRPLPTNCYDRSFSLRQFDIEVHDLGDAHSLGNRAIMHTPTKILFYIDIIFPGWSMYRDLAQAEYTPEFIEAHDIILRLDFDIIIGGHVSRWGNRTDVEIQRSFVRDLYANSAYALAHVDYQGTAQEFGIFDPTSENFGNYWVLLNEQIERWLILALHVHMLLGKED